MTITTTREQFRNRLDDALDLAEEDDLVWLFTRLSERLVSAGIHGTAYQSLVAHDHETFIEMAETAAVIEA